jgi:hypothetical protein
MENNLELIKWCLEQTGVKLLEICQQPEEGFERVNTNCDFTLYGINPKPEFDWDKIDVVRTAEDARFGKYITHDFPDIFYERSQRMGCDMLKHSKKNDIPFYNGKHAKLKELYSEGGKLPRNQVLNLKIGYTSYFTEIGTNIHFNGYDYRYCDLPPEPQLEDRIRWPILPDWRKALKESLLANDLAVDLILYNDSEVLYVRRDKVGQESGKWSSTVNGVMEFTDEEDDRIDGLPDIYNTAKRETKNELNIDIDPSQVFWIGVGASIDRCEPFLVGAYRITENREKVEKLANKATEKGEVSNRIEKGVYRKEVRGIQYNRDSPEVTINIGKGKSTVGLAKLRAPSPTQRVTTLKQLICEKIINKIEIHEGSSRPKEPWTDEGAGSLLLGLIHIYGMEKISQLIAELKV